MSSDWDAPLATRPDWFELHIQLLLRRGYTPATFSDVVLARPDAGLVAITFDDAFQSVYTRALPILARHNVPATLFVPTDFIDGGGPLRWDGIDQWMDSRWKDELTPMTWPEIREVAAAGWEIGSHTCSHPRLTQLDDAALLAELTRSRVICEERLSAPCSAIAYPYGDADVRVTDAARAAGYASAGGLPGSFGSRDAYQWPRVGIYRVDDERRFRIKISLTVERLRAHPIWDLWTSRQRMSTTVTERAR